MQATSFISTILWQLVIVVHQSQGNPIGNRPGCIEQPCFATLMESPGQDNVGCYSFEASDGTSFCSTALACETLSPCDENNRCASTELACVVKSCCLEPVCIPINVARHLCPISEFVFDVNIQAPQRNRTRRDGPRAIDNILSIQQTPPTPPTEPIPMTPPTPPTEPTPMTPPTPPTEPTPITPPAHTIPTTPGSLTRCAKTEVHVIGIYEAANLGFNEHVMKDVTVILARTGDQVLVLSSYEPIRWRVILLKNVRLRAVHLIGYYDQRLAPITDNRNIKVTKDIRTNAVCGYSWPYNGQGCDTNELLKLAQKRAGNNITSFHGCYRASVWSIDVNAKATSNCDTAAGYYQYSYNPPCLSTSVWQQVNFITSNKASCSGKRYVQFNTKYNLWIGAILCGSEKRYKLYLSPDKKGSFLQIADYAGHGQDHCELVNPTFRIPDEDDITSGGCALCATGNLLDVQNVYVYARAYYGEQFERVKSTVWADLTTDWYECGVAIP